MSDPQPVSSLASEQPGSFLNPQNEKERQMIAAMDLIRALGIESINPLPQLVVCGAQSAGKSSVLGAITGIPFPSGNGLCTRYVVKVTLVHSETDSLTVTIEPDLRTEQSRRSKLERFRRNESLAHNPRETLRECMEAAHDAIFSDDNDTTIISRDVLVVEIKGPQKRALQLIDLPGLIEVHEEKTVIDTINSIVKDYIKMEHSTILAVIDGSVEPDQAKILTWCKEKANASKRTLVIVTRPDRAESSRQDKIVEILNGNSPTYSMFGWHVLRNLDGESRNRDNPAQERDDQEKDFFQEHPWSQLSSKIRQKLGIEQLRSTLRTMYFTAAGKELPAFEKKVLRLLEDEKFRCLTKPVPDDDLEKTFKVVIKRLRKAASEHAQGNYRHSLSNRPDDGPERLRARIREHDRRFHKDITNTGHTWLSHASIQPLNSDNGLSNGHHPPTPPLDATFESRREQFADLKTEVAMVSKMLEETSGNELEGFFDPQRVNDLVWRQSKGWHKIAEKHIEKVSICCEKYFEQITKMEFASTEDSIRLDQPPDGFQNFEMVASRFLRKCILPKLVLAKKEASYELWRIEKDNRDFAKNSDSRFLLDQKNHRKKVEFRNYILALRSQQNGESSHASNYEVLDTDTVAAQRGISKPEGYRDHNAEDYLFAMQSHYVIARDIFIANVLMQVQERHFLRDIEELIPDDLTLDQIKELTKEDSDLAAKKERLQGERNKLKEAYHALQRCQ